MRIKKHKYDVVIIGGGPNGLLSGAYLARAGLKVCVLEKKLEMGGGLLTEEVNYGGIYHNTHAIFMPMIDYAPAIKDLEIEKRHMVSFILPELQMSMLGSDGSTISLYNDPKKTAESFAVYSKKDAEQYVKLAKKFEEWMEDFTGPYTYVQPKPTLEIAFAMHQLEMGREMFAQTERTPKELVEEWFEHDKVRALMLNAIGFWGLDPEQSGLGYLIGLYFNRSYNYRLVKRGSHQLAQAMMRDILLHKGTLLTSQVIDRIIVENGSAKGVATADGDIYEADVVISTLDLHQTFLKYLGEDKLPKDFTAGIKMWMWEKHSYLSCYVDIDNPAAVKLKVGANNPALDRSLIYIVGCDGVSDYMAHIEATEKGEVGNVMYVSFPTSFDPDQIRLEDKHTALLQKHAPYDLKKGKTWDKYSFYDKRKLGNEMIEKAWGHISNYTMDDVLTYSVSTPFDVGNKFLDMVKGGIKQGQYFPLQMGYMRPNEECSTHRSPVKGLYMGGACTYPGGTILMSNGFLAADAVCEDLGIDKWWGVPDCIKRAKEKNPDIPL